MQYQLMGVLNVTPDSFSDGGQFLDPNRALKQALQLIQDGADIIDIGGEASGPSSTYVSLDEETRRIIPVIQAIRKQSNIPISVDTYKSEVADLALQNGANMINDITALRADNQMLNVIQKHKAKICIMYAKDPTARTTQTAKCYEDIIQDIYNFLKARLVLLESAKIPKEQIVIDPGMGAFLSSIPKYSYEVIAKLQKLKTLHPNILLAISRKSFLLDDFQTRDLRAQSLSAIAILNGATILRTHELKSLKAYLDQAFCLPKA